MSRFILLQTPSTDITYKVIRENLVDTVQVSGTFTNASQVQVVSPTNGILTKIFVNNGTTVKKGDPLFYVESTATEDQKKAAYSNYLSASSVVKADQANLYTLQSTMFNAWKTFFNLSTSSTYQNADGSPNTTNRTAPEFTTAQDNWLASEATYQNQQSVIAKDQAALNTEKQLYDETQSTTVISPIGGTIANLLANEGDQVASTTNVLIVANFGNPHIDAAISEDYASRVIAGQQANMVFDSMKERTFSGRVEAIGIVGTNASGVVTFPARIEVESLPLSIKPGMTALITIETLRVNNILDVPNSAVITRNGYPCVIEAGTHKYFPVMLGTKGVAKTEIIQGLQEGTKVLANPTSVTN